MSHNLIVDPARTVEFSQLQAVIGGMNEALLAFDLSGAFLFANRAALSVYGFEHEGDIRQNVHDLDALFELFELNNEPLPAEAYPAARVLRGETFVGYEVWIQKRGESRR